jgi:serine protease AprX
VTLYPRIDGVDAAWSQGLTGSGQGLPGLDSGVNPTNDLGGKRPTQVAASPSITGVSDEVGHGTFVATVAAGRSADGRYIGIAPDANVFEVKVAANDGVYTSDIISGLAWVLGHHKDISVVNLSLSETIPSNYQTDALDRAVEALWKAGVVVVASAGNNGPNTALYAPGNDSFVITVGASDSTDTASTADDTLASFSTYGTTLGASSSPTSSRPAGASSPTSRAAPSWTRWPRPRTTSSPATCG